MTRADSTHFDVVLAANRAVRTAASDGAAHAFLCECGDLACARGVLLTGEQYDELRRSLNAARIVHSDCTARESRRAEPAPLARAAALVRRLLDGRRDV